MPDTYTKGRLAEARERVRGIREIATVGGKPTHDEKLILALDSALSTAEQELVFFKQRERDICKAVGGVSDGGRYRADVIEHLQIVYEKAQERDALAARCAELEARLQGAGWISVEEKKPEIGAICIVAKAGEVLGFSQWGSKDIPMPMWVLPKAPMYAAWIGQEITHWMPLPESPILGEKKED